MLKTIAILSVVVIVAFITVTSPTRACAADEQKAVLITGASSGIGRMTAERLAGAGYFVYAGARKKRDI